MSVDKGHQLGTRLVVGPLVLAAVGALFWSDLRAHQHLGLAFLMTALVAAALAEFYAMAQKLGHRPMRTLGVAVGALLTAAHARWLEGGSLGLDPTAPAFLALLIGAFAVAMARPASQRRMDDIAITLFGLVYLWLPLSFAMRLRTEPAWGGTWALGGHAAMLFAVAAGKGSDIGAYFVGSRLGKHYLAPALSPKKTWEGMAGALLGGALGGWLVARYCPALPATPHQAAVLGAALAPAGQLADLWKSLFKRQAGVKDSGRVLPALGGVLDMVDSLVLFIPGTYYGLLVLGRHA